MVLQLDHHPSHIKISKNKGPQAWHGIGFIIIIVIICLFAVPSMSRAQAANDTFDLVLGGTYSMPWNVSDILPGMGGNASINLTNAGPAPGIVYVWVDDVRGTGGRDSGAALQNYLRFSITSPRLSSAVPLDAPLTSFLPAPTGPAPIPIARLAVGETVTVYWGWAFIDTGAPQNDAQNESLSFNIYYMLADLPSTTPTPTATTGSPALSGTATPSATSGPVITAKPMPTEAPNIYFVSPTRGAVITNNTTMLKTRVYPQNDTGYVLYFGSTDNRTWMLLGKSPVTGNVSVLMWNVPRMDGTYYLEADHYNSPGLKGVTYTQVLIARQISPAGTPNKSLSSSTWLTIISLLAVLALIFFATLYVKRR